MKKWGAGGKKPQTENDLFVPVQQCQDLEAYCIETFKDGKQRKRAIPVYLLMIYQAFLTPKKAPDKSVKLPMKSRLSRPLEI